MLTIVDADVGFKIRSSHVGDNGYMYVFPDEPHSKSKLLHRAVVEKVMGRELKPNEIVHHIDGNPLNNNKNNLLVCTQTYHLIIHARERIFNLGGHPDTHSYCWKCENIHTRDKFNNLKTNWNGKAGVCREYENARRRKAKYKSKKLTTQREKTLQYMRGMKWYYKKKGQEDKVCWLW